MKSIVLEVMRFKTVEQYRLVLWMRKLINKITQQ